MRYILAKREVDRLVQIAWSRVLVAFDFDGTLAPIVADRDQAAMRRRTRDLFLRVCELHTCAVISGRGCEDVTGRLGGARVKYVIGNHGMEPGAGMEAFARQVAAVRPALHGALALEPGVDIEDKQYSIAIHYRRSRRRNEALRAIHEAVAKLPIPMRVVPGKLVVNVVPAGAPNKGDALLDLRARDGADTALFVGDDVTDEDVFELDQPGRLLAVRVGASRKSAAAYYLRDQREIDDLLTVLVAAGTERRKP